MFQRMREPAVQAISGSNTNADRAALNNEYQELSEEVQQISENTQWNGTNILDDTSAMVQTVSFAGAFAESDVISYKIDSVS